MSFEGVPNVEASVRKSPWM